MEAFLTGGLPPHIDEPCPADQVYEATFRRVMVQNKKYYTRVPGDVQVVKDVVNFLSSQERGSVETPAGNVLRPRTLQLLGLTCAPPRRVAASPRVAPLRCDSAVQALRRSARALPPRWCELAADSPHARMRYCWHDAARPGAAPVIRASYATQRASANQDAPQAAETLPPPARARLHQ